MIAGASSGFAGATGRTAGPTCHGSADSRRQAYIFREGAGAGMAGVRAAMIWTRSGGPGAFFGSIGFVLSLTTGG